VVGEPGFGAAPSARGPVDVPQLGRVILQDGVTLGANSCIDRGAWDDTSVGENTKIDNLVHVAHNVRLGRNCLLAAYTGISGSVVIGDGVMFGGKAGVADHLTRSGRARRRRRGLGVQGHSGRRDVDRLSGAADQALDARDGLVVAGRRPAGEKSE
jgi:hypothetical protein